MLLLLESSSSSCSAVVRKAPRALLACFRQKEEKCEEHEELRQGGSGQ